MTPVLDQTRAERLIQIARECFNPELSEAELKVLRDSTCSLDPPESERKGPNPKVSAEFIRWLATDPQTLPYIDQRGIFVWIATVSGELDLWNCRVHSVLRLKSCTFHAKVSLQSAETRALEFSGSSFEKGISAGQLVARGSVWLDRVRTSAIVDFIGARIEGDLICSGASLAPAKDADSQSKAYFQGGALSADRAIISGAVFMNEGFESSGEVRMVNAKIGSDLICYGAKLTSTGPALSMWRAEIGGAVYFDDGFESSGQISLSNANIEGMVSCSGMILTVKDGLDQTAFDLNGAVVGDAVYLEDFESSGLVQMMGIHVKHNIEFRRAKLSAIGNSLWLGGSEIGGDVLFADGFDSFGAVNLHGASISGDLRFIGVTVRHVFCTNARLGGDFAWLGIRALGRLSLAGTSLRKLRDDRASWPPKDSLLIDNLVYEDVILQRSPTAKEIEKGWYSEDIERDLARTEWLERQPRDRQLEPQPWMQLSKVLENKGNHKAAKRVIREYQHVKVKGLHWPGRAVAVVFALLEESPARIGYSISLLLLLGWFIFSHAGASGALAPTDREAYVAYTAGQPMPSAYPVLQPAIYTLENALPLVRLGQDDKWAPDRRHRATDWFTSYWFLMWVRWILILFGWFQATIFAAALASRFKP